MILPSFALLAGSASSWLGWVIGALFIIYFACKFFKNVGGTEIMETERRFWGSGLPAGRAFAIKGQVGLEAAYRSTGIRIVLWPIVREVKRTPFTKIPEDKLGIITANDGEPLPGGRIFAEDKAGVHHNNFQDPVAFLENGGIRGQQLRVLTTGQYKLHSKVFSVEFIDKTRIPEGKVGIVVALDGEALLPGQLLGRSVDGHDNFQQAEVFLQNHGQKGPQVDILRPGVYNIHTGMFKVEIVNAVSITDGKIGVVEALGGEPMPIGDVISDTPVGSNNFQDGEAFLHNHGKRGPQTAILAPGTYYINTKLFKVTERDQTQVKQGEVAVLITNHGRDPSEILPEAALAEPLPTPGLSNVEGNAKDPAERRLDENNRQRHVVPRGYRGIQKEVLGPGRYNINPLEHQIVKVPTTMRSVEWAADRDTVQGKGIDSTFDPFEVVSFDGFPMKVEVRCQYRILPENAPYVISKLGSVEELEKNVIHPQIDGIFRAEVSKSPAIHYQQKRAEEQMKAFTEVRADLSNYKVDVVSVMITNIHLPEKLMETTQQKNLAEVMREMYGEQQKTAATRIQLEQTTAQADNQKKIIEAETGIMVAEHKASQRAKEADGEARFIELTAGAKAEATRKVGLAEAEVIEAKGNAAGAGFMKQAEALGQRGIAALEIMKQIREGGIQIVPKNLSTGGGVNGGGGLVDLLVLQMLDRNSDDEAKPTVAAPAADVKSAAAEEESAPATAEKPTSLKK